MEQVAVKINLNPSELSAHLLERINILEKEQQHIKIFERVQKEFRKRNQKENEALFAKLSTVQSHVTEIRDTLYQRMAKDSILVTKENAALSIGVSYRTVNRYIKEETFGKIDVDLDGVQMIPEEVVDLIKSFKYNKKSKKNKNRKLNK